MVRSHKGSVTVDEGPWFALARALREAAANKTLALKGLVEADKRFFALSRRAQRHARSTWYKKACDADALAAEAYEAIEAQIASTPAPTRMGLYLKVRLLAEAYRVDLDNQAVPAREENDLVARLIRSLAADLTMQDRQ